MSGAGGSQRRLLKTLADSSADFVLIGGHAVAAHGYERATRDVDIVYSTDTGSCEALAGALRELGAAVEFADEPAPEGRLDGGWLARGGHFRFATDAGPLDALSTVAGRDYEALAAAAVPVDLSGSEIFICSFDDLRAMKAAGSRPADEEDLRRLAEARGEAEAES